MKLDLRRKDATILELGRQAGALKSSNAWRSVRRASLVDEARKSAGLRSFKDWPRKPERPLTRGGPAEVTTCSGSQSPLCKLQTTRSGKSMLSSTRAPTTVLRTHATLLRARPTSADGFAAHCDGQAQGSPIRTRRPAPEPGEDGNAKLPGPTARVCIQRLRGSRLLHPVRLSPVQAASANALRHGVRRGQLAHVSRAHPRPSAPRELPACEHAEDAECPAKTVTKQMLRPHPEDSEGSTSTSCSEEDSETDEARCRRHCSHQVKPQHEYLLKLDLTLVSKHMATSVLEGQSWDVQRHKVFCPFEKVLQSLKLPEGDPLWLGGALRRSWHRLLPGAVLLVPLALALWMNSGAGDENLEACALTHGSTKLHMLFF
ncbi:SNW1 [Symbiodinium necroappetens]|uniref:SNW1 protein n=1 Tax=Symbiodinium necroappetens TaxID=1628268 RepID=A0A812V2T1_9DINO|nr:SNW1 [Symbiodinium necroappetens]